jgi:hypothetical protein
MTNINDDRPIRYGGAHPSVQRPPCPKRIIMSIYMLIYLLPSAYRAESAELKLLNPEIFGRNVSKPIKVLMEGEGVEPSFVQLDIKEGVFSAATVKYTTPMSLADARRSVNRLYSMWQKPHFADDPLMGMWRDEEHGLSIQLTRDRDVVVLIYISRKPLTSKLNLKVRQQDQDRQAGRQVSSFSPMAPISPTATIRWPGGSPQRLRTAPTPS